MSLIVDEQKKKRKFWSYTEWENAGLKSSNFTGFKLYVIKCFDKNEEFYKIGKTFTSLYQRFKSYSLPYDYEIILTHEGDARKVSLLENYLHKNLKEFKYKPSKTFKGMTECFTQYKIKTN